MYIYIYIGNMYTGSAKRGISQLIFIYNIYIYILYMRVYIVMCTSVSIMYMLVYACMCRLLCVLENILLSISLCSHTASFFQVHVPSIRKNNKLK